MRNEKNEIDINKYKGAIIQYMCQDCKKCEEFFEELTNKISRIKSGNCSHFTLKFIYNNLGRGNFKYIVSFNCKNCKDNKIINLFDENSMNNTSYINYKCEKCRKGPINVELLLIEQMVNDEGSFEDKNIIKNNKNNINLSDTNNKINNDNMFRNQQVNWIQQNNYNNINNQQINNDNNMFNNNMMFNNMMINNNAMFNMQFNNMNKNIYANNMLFLNRNNNNNNNQIKLIFKDTKGLSFELSASPDKVFGEIVRNLFNNYKQIDKDNIANFLFNGNRIKMQKTLSENKLENNSKILIIYNS